MKEDKQTIQRAGIEGISTILNEISLSANEIFKTISKEMSTLQGNSLFLGEASTALLDRYKKFESEFPRFIKEIDNYSSFMTKTLASYKETDQAIESTVSESLNREIAKLSDSGDIGNEDTI